MNRRGDANPDWGILPEEDLVPVTPATSGELAPPPGEELQGRETLPPDDHAPTEPAPPYDEEDNSFVPVDVSDEELPF